MASPKMRHWNDIMRLKSAVVYTFLRVRQDRDGFPLISMACPVAKLTLKKAAAISDEKVT